MRRAEEIWPEDIYPSVPKEAWPKIRKVIQDTTGISMERVAADLMRRGYRSALYELAKEIGEAVE